MCRRVAGPLPRSTFILLTAPSEGLSNGQVGQRPYEMGYQAMHILKDIAEGTAVEDPIYTGLDICTTENAADCLGSSE
jgi:ribose transport system substrate-binding protein